MSKHTPGPWEAGTVALTDTDGEGFNFSGGDWEVYPPLGESGPVAICNSEANAALIARAPEMAEEIERLQKQLAFVVQSDIDALVGMRLRMERAEAQRDRLKEAAKKSLTYYDRYVAETSQYGDEMADLRAALEECDK